MKLFMIEKINNLQQKKLNFKYKYKFNIYVILFIKLILS